MAKAEYIISLIKSHYNNEPERFSTVALQIAAHEAKLGHTFVANEIKNIIDKAKETKHKNKILAPDLQGLIQENVPAVNLSNIIAPQDIKSKINRIISEFVQRDKLLKHDLENRRKIMLSGPPGTGKTLTASIVANELKLPLYTILMDKMVTKFMGETSAKLRQVFDLIEQRQGVYLFDEFDAIGGERSRDNDVGEMRRVLNSFLQFIERDSSDSLIIAITNNKELLDQALFRRFDDVILYNLPSSEEKEELLKNRLAQFAKKIKFKDLLPDINGLSHAEISLACIDAIKETVLNEKQPMNNELILKAIKDRNAAYHK
ncbi:AAA family ATPase [Chryseobacterium sp.]|uniref:AAA family ATPase n=1 Tax=Chryseobacterium sp. TaxID=1871047 RepID=UPI0011C80267|nr:ATP-binding protein [Chryseobacterium sp.]TXF78841.1 ATP-binding protein [Chryseobacterium sp.]